MANKRKVPLRKCIVTRELKPKDDLIRIVRNKEGEVSIDPTGKKNGRGAYLQKDSKVIGMAQESHALEKQFSVKIDPTIYEQLNKLVADNEHE